VCGQAHCVDLLWPDISGLPIRDLRLGNFTFVPGLSGACTVPLQAARVLNARVPAAYAGCTRRARGWGGRRARAGASPGRLRACCGCRANVQQREVNGKEPGGLVRSPRVRVVTAAVPLRACDATARRAGAFGRAGCSCVLLCAGAWCA